MPSPINAEVRPDAVNVAEHRAKKAAEVARGCLTRAEDAVTVARFEAIRAEAYYAGYREARQLLQKLFSLPENPDNECPSEKG